MTRGFLQLTGVFAFLQRYALMDYPSCVLMDYPSSRSVSYEILMSNEAGEGQLQTLLTCFEPLLFLRLTDGTDDSREESARDAIHGWRSGWHFRPIPT
jgi:hypothetical protein